MLIEVFQGDTSDIIYVRPGPLSTGDPIDANWKCHVSVLNYAGDIEVVKTEITDKTTAPVTVDGLTTDEEVFLCALTPTQTESLSADVEETLHNWAIEVSNTTTTPPFNLEEHVQLNVKEQAIA